MQNAQNTKPRLEISYGPVKDLETRTWRIVSRSFNPVIVQEMAISV